MFDGILAWEYTLIPAVSLFLLRFPTGSIRIGSAFCFAADLDLLVFDVVAHIAADTLLGHARLFDGHLAFGLRFSVAGVSAPSPQV